MNMPSRVHNPQISQFAEARDHLLHSIDKCQDDSTREFLKLMLTAMDRKMSQLETSERDGTGCQSSAPAGSGRMDAWRRKAAAWLRQQGAPWSVRSRTF